MKKLLALLLAVVLVAAFTACGGSGTNENPTEPGTNPTEIDPEVGEVTGGYTIKEDITAVELPADVKDAFELALEGYTGMGFTPVAYLGSQVVAGANYAVLCLGKTVVPGSKAELKVVVINKDLQGKASVLRVNDFNLSDYVGAKKDNASDSQAPVQLADIKTDGADTLVLALDEAPVEAKAPLEAPVNEVPDEAKAPADEAPVEENPISGNLAGGWTLNTEYPEAVLTEEEKAACAVFEGVMGTQYQPVACLATQVVAGINYAMLVKTTTTAAQVVDGLKVVTIYSGVDGSLEVLGTADIDLAKIAG